MELTAMVKSQGEPLVYILVLNWCSADDTIQCIETIEQQTYKNYKIVIIDNGSPDSSEAKLRNRFPNHEFIQTGKNLGYAGGNNIGIRYALKQGAEYVWILNPDIRVRYDSLNRLVSLLEANLKIGICGPLIKEGLPPFIKIYGPHYLKVNQGYLVDRPAVTQAMCAIERKMIDTDYVTGCSILIRTKVFVEIGLLREDFFMYYEETELCWRAKKNGWESTICVEAQDRHLRLKQGKNDLDDYLLRNAVIFARLENKHILQTVYYQLRLRRIFAFISKGRLKEALHVLKRRLLPIMVGLLKPIKSIPKNL